MNIRNIAYVIVVSMVIAVSIACETEPEPTAVVQVQPTDTATAVVPTATVEPTSTNTPEPTPTPLLPTATHTPEPTPTPTLEPTPTEIPPTATFAPEPTATQVPPTATEIVVSIDNLIAIESQAWDLVFGAWESQGGLEEQCDAYQPYVKPSQDTLDDVFESLVEGFGDEYTFILPTGTLEGYLTLEGYHKAFPKHCNVSGIVHESTVWEIMVAAGEHYPEISEILDDYCDRYTRIPVPDQGWIDENGLAIVDLLDSTYWLVTVDFTVAGFQAAMQQHCKDARLKIRHETDFWHLAIGPATPSELLKTDMCVEYHKEPKDPASLELMVDFALKIIADHMSPVFNFEELILTQDGFLEAAQLYCDQ